jgi:hypothetical protein
MNFEPVAHFCKTSYLEFWDMKDHGSRPAQAKIFQYLSQWIKTGCGGVAIIPVLVGNLKYENCGRSLHEQKVRPYLQNNQKRAGSLAQLVRWLPYKHEWSPQFKLQYQQKREKFLVKKFHYMNYKWVLNLRMFYFNPVRMVIIKRISNNKRW